MKLEEALNRWVRDLTIPCPHSLYFARQIYLAKTAHPASPWALSYLVWGTAAGSAEEWLAGCMGWRSCHAELSCKCLSRHWVCPELSEVVKMVKVVNFCSLRCALHDYTPSCAFWDRASFPRQVLLTPRTVPVPCREVCGSWLPSCWTSISWSCLALSLLLCMADRRVMVENQ